jgi:micrococcal nuclease
MHRLAIVAMLGTLAVSATIAAPINSDDVRVIDGDTIRIYNKKPDVRLVGFNAPETHKGCKAERELGAEAKRRLQELVQGGHLDLEFVACSCPAGTVGALKCNYGRSCGTLNADGHDVGAILIGQGLAVPFICGETRCPVTPRPWCGEQPPSKAKMASF